MVALGEDHLLVVEDWEVPRVDQVRFVLLDQVVDKVLLGEILTLVKGSQVLLHVLINQRLLDRILLPLAVLDLLLLLLSCLDLLEVGWHRVHLPVRVGRDLLK